MNERAAVCLGALAGAVAGGAFGYLYLTDRGRRLRSDLEPRLTDLVTELQKTWEAGRQARAVIEQPWRTAPGPGGVR